METESEIKFKIVSLYYLIKYKINNILPSGKYLVCKRIGPQKICAMCVAYKWMGITYKTYKV